MKDKIKLILLWIFSILFTWMSLGTLVSNLIFFSFLGFLVGVIALICSVSLIPPINKRIKNNQLNIKQIKIEKLNKYLIITILIILFLVSPIILAFNSNISVDSEQTNNQESDQLGMRVLPDSKSETPSSQQTESSKEDKIESDKSFTTEETNIPKVITKDGYKVTLSKVYYCVKDLNVYKDGWMNSLLNQKVSPEIYDGIREAYIKNYKSKFTDKRSETQKELNKYLQYLKQDLCVYIKIIAPEEYSYVSNHIYLYDAEIKKLYRLYDRLVGGSFPQKEFSIAKRFWELSFNDNQIFYIFIHTKDSRFPISCQLLPEQDSDPPRDYDCDVDKVKEEHNVFVFEVSGEDIV